jgi:hypothetical protein
LNTLTNAYVKKFSSGTILALLAISGLLFLVPATVPAFASNANLPTVTVTSNNPVFGGSAGNVISLKICNPSGNSFTVTGFSVAAPSGWTVTGAGIGGYLVTSHFTTSGASWTVSTYTVGTGAGIPVGQCDTVTITATAPTGTYPINSLFTSETQDASAVGYYAGPSFSVLVIDPATVVAITVTPGGSNTQVAYTAGTAVYTVTATVTATAAEPGLVINFVDTGTGATSANYPSSFGSSSVTTSGATATTATATTTFQPSEVLGNTGIPKVTIGTCAAAACTATDANTITTAAGTPSAVTVTAGGSSTHTDYITAKGTGVYSGAVLSAEIAAGGLTGSLTDAFGNAVTAGITFAAGQGCNLISFGGLFDTGVAAAAPVTTDTIAGGAAGCTVAGAIASSDNYFQGLTFGSSSYVQVSMTGTYATATFTASGKSQTLSTSSMDAAASTPACSGPVPNCTAAQNVIAGSAAGVVSTITLTYTLATNQLGVPITFLGVNTTNPYAGSFVGGSGSIHHFVGATSVHDFANVTVTSVENSAGTAAIATATFTIDPTLGAAVTFEAQFAHPLTGLPANIVGPSAPSFAVTTIAGAPSKLLVNTYFDTGLAHATTKTIPGQNDYLNVILTDYWGNTAVNNGGQLQIALTVSPSGSGALSATSVYISQFASDTHGSFGTITFAVSSGASLGTITITAAGFFSGSGTLTVVSPNPTITVNTPSGTIGHIVYSGFSGVGLSGSAAVSAGVFPAPTIASVSYSVDGGTAQTATGTASWSVVVTLANGLHTVSFTAKDSAGSVSASNTTTILIDTGAPTITAPTTLAYGAGTPVCFSVTDSEGDLNAASVTATSNSSATLTTTVTGTNNPGAPVTYQACVAGLPATTGHWGLTLNAKNLAGNAATAKTAVVQVTVAFAQSLVLTGSLASSVVGGYTGVSGTFSNQWSASQNVIVFAVWKNSAGQTVYVSAGSATISAGGSQSFFLPEVGLASGGYTVNVSVWTTTGQPVSVQTPISVTV